MTATFTMMGSAALAFLMSLALSIFVYRHRRRLKRAEKRLFNIKADAEKKAAAALAVTQAAFKPAVTQAAHPAAQPGPLLALEHKLKEERPGSVIPWTHVKLERVLANGAMGRIFRASQEGSDQTLALRRLNVPVLNLHSHPEWEAQIAKLHKLDHPNLLKVIALATDGMRNYGILTPHLPYSLAQMLARTSGSLLLESQFRVVWVNLAADIAAGLAYLHVHEVAHRALHPQNVMLEGDMSVKLCDFGRSPETLINLLENKGGEEEEEEDTEASEDSRRYMAPELLRFDTFDKEADLWSFGCLLVRMATLQPLYSVATSGASTHIVLLRAAVGELNPLSDVMEEDIHPSSPLLPLLQACLDFDPWQRPACTDLAEELSYMTTKAKQRKPTKTILPQARTLPSFRPAAPASASAVRRAVAEPVDPEEADDEEPIHLILSPQARSLPTPESAVRRAVAEPIDPEEADDDEEPVHLSLSPSARSLQPSARSLPPSARSLYVPPSSARRVVAEAIDSEEEEDEDEEDDEDDEPIHLPLSPFKSPRVLAAGVKVGDSDSDDDDDDEEHDELATDRLTPGYKVASVESVERKLSRLADELRGALQAEGLPVDSAQTPQDSAQPTQAPAAKGGRTLKPPPPTPQASFYSAPPPVAPQVSDQVPEGAQSRRVPREPGTERRGRPATLDPRAHSRSLFALEPIAIPSSSGLQTERDRMTRRTEGDISDRDAAILASFANLGDRTRRTEGDVSDRDAAILASFANLGASPSATLSTDAVWPSLVEGGEEGRIVVPDMESSALTLQRTPSSNDRRLATTDDEHISPRTLGLILETANTAEIRGRRVHI
jgi:serine/threonine protein kinase